jgi:hypothetical protein
MSITAATSGPADFVAPAPRADRGDARPTRNDARDDAAPAPFARVLNSVKSPKPASDKPATDKPAADDAASGATEHDAAAKADGAEGAADAAAAATTALDTLRYGLLAETVAAAAALAAATPNAAASAAPAADATDAAEHAAGEAAAAGTALGAAGVSAELRERVGRVIERMRDEFGHEVQVVETARTQERQDALYAQGRTASGPVVTWTQHSQHTLGRAADVMIDGGYGDAQAFAQLQQVAREEGLHTLGPRDPGHLELPRGMRVESVSVADTGAAQPNGATGAGKLAAALAATATNVTDAGESRGTARSAERAATLAEAAQVAPVAPVARVATVATTASVAGVAQPGVAAAGAPGGRQAGGEQKRDEHSGARRDDHARAAAPTQPMAAPQSAAPAPAAATVAAPVAAVATDAVDRVSAVREIQDAGGARSLSHITLRLDGAAGVQETIRVDLRGATVGATIAVDDHAVADRLRTGVGELREALGRHGLTADTVQISAAGRGASESVSPVDAARATAAIAGAAAAERGGDAGGQGAADQQHTPRDHTQREQREGGGRDGQRESRDANRERYAAAREQAGDGRQRRQRAQPDER